MLSSTVACASGPVPEMKHLISPLLLLWLTTPGIAQNILLFTIDSCRADRFGCYGHTNKTTPNIDAWARTGTVFKNSYSTSSWTAPGLASVLTGLYPPTHGINNRDHMGSKDLPTLIKIFMKRGHRVPNLNFFTFAPYYQNFGLGKIERQYFGANDGEELINWLEKNTGESDSEPFCLWYHNVMIHQPYNPAEKDLPAPRAELYQSPGIKAAMTGAIVPLGSTHFTESDRPVLDALYDAEIRRVDQLFAQALEVLKRRNLLDKTLIVLTADHGEEILDHGFIGHASTSLQAKLYEEFIRIPLIMSWPGKVPSGKVVSYLASQIDVLPTILKLQEIEIPSHIQGLDLMQIDHDRTLFFESVIAGNQTTREREHLWVRAIRKGHYKYISDGQLLDLSTDPLEQKNLAEKEPEKARNLGSELKQWLSDMTAVRSQIFKGEVQVYSAASPNECVQVWSPQNKQTQDYDLYTGAILFDWRGDMETTYLIEYDIGTGDHAIAGTYEIRGNHQLLGPFSRELWNSLKAWNPFRFRVSGRTPEPCWSSWVEFQF